MRRALLYILVGAALATDLTAAEQKAWKKIRYVGGTVAVKASRYDFNTTLTVASNSDVITIVIASAKLFATQQTVKIKYSQVVSLSQGMRAWHRVEEVPGAQLPSKAPTLFGIMETNGFLGIVYDAGGGKRGAVLLDSYQTWSILQVLTALTGKEVESR